ncbi:MAG: hypothetical protein MRZ79_13280 [Bacteroidia bacterium]|nr:hypothetical protein [Bacteroidia bacterium]
MELIDPSIIEFLSQPKGCLLLKAILLVFLTGFVGLFIRTLLSAFAGGFFKEGLWYAYIAFFMILEFSMNYFQNIFTECSASLEFPVMILDYILKGILIFKGIRALYDGEFFTFIFWAGLSWLAAFYFARNIGAEVIENMRPMVNCLCA